MNKSELSILGEYHLTSNPYPASGISPAIDGKFDFPKGLKTKFQDVVKRIEKDRGVKALTITGPYGSGKTTFLQNYIQSEFHKMQFMTFFFPAISWPIVT